MGIDRETVLHVARLARLDLRADEVDRLTTELDAILDAVSKVAELDLAGVPPTSHPLDLVNVWADDEPRPSLSLDEAFANAPAREGDLFRVPPDGRPRGVGVIDTLRLTAEEALGLIERKEVSSAELHAAYLAAAGERDGELHAYLRLVEGAEGTGVPIALKDVISTKGVETTAGSKILAGYVPVFDSTVAARCKEAGLPLIGKTNTDEFAMGSSTENSAYGPSRNPWDPSRVPGGSGGGTAAAVSGGLAPWGLGSDTGGSIKQPSALCGNVGLRPTYGTVSRYGIVAFASSLDQIGPVAKTVRDVARLYAIIAGRDVNDSTTVELPEAVELPTAEELDRAQDRDPEAGLGPAGHRAGRPRVVRGRDRDGTLARRRDRRVRPAALVRLRDGLLLPDRPGGGVVEPRPLRRRALRPARRGSDLPRDGRADARRGIRRRAEAPHHARHLRALGRLLRRLLRPGAAGADAAHPRAPGGARRAST